MNYLAGKLDKDTYREMRYFFKNFRPTISGPDNRQERDAEVMEAWRNSQGTVQEFCQIQARKWKCSSRTVRRILERNIKRAA